MSPQVSPRRRADQAFDSSRRAETASWFDAAHPGCPACRLRDRDVVRWLDSFASEHHADVGIITTLRSSRGFCAPHARRLLANSAASSLLTTVYADVLPAAAADLASRPGSSSTPCPACEQGEGAAARVFSQLRTDLTDPQLREAYLAHGGLCLPDALLFCSGASAPAAGFVLGAVRQQLDGDRLVDTLAGQDGDAVHRDRLRRSAHNDVVADYRRRLGLVRPRDRLAELLGDERCPVCASGARQLFEQLSWLLEVEPTELRVEEMLLCAAHLRDVVLADPAAGSRFAEANAVVLRGRLDRLLQRVASGRSADWSKPDRATAEAVVALAALSVCRLCNSTEQGMQRGADLVVSMLGDPATGAVFSSGHGSCVRHAHAWSDPATAVTVRRIAIQRIAELVWELNEAKLKSVWWNRYEARGAEATAWQRAPEILDGWVYLGIGGPRQSALARG